MDTSQIAIATAKAMDAMEQEYDKYPDARVAAAAIVVEVRFTDEDGDDMSSTPTYCSNDSRVYQTGLFEWAHESVKTYGGPIGEDDDDE